MSTYRRTLYPALRLWHAELRAGLDGQDWRCPLTWCGVRPGTEDDPLYRAAILELRAMDANDQRDHAAALTFARDARRVFCPTPGSTPFAPPHDQAYRDALNARAVERLGSVTAAALAVHARPRGHICEGCGEERTHGPRRWPAG